MVGFDPTAGVAAERQQVRGERHRRRRRSRLLRLGRSRSGGEPFVRSLARRVGRFRWQEVGGDVLKVLYESVITAEPRKRLGEYYTPDWLAERIVATAMTRPLENRVLDRVRLRHLPLSCSPALPRRGRGGWQVTSRGRGLRLTRHVFGMDLHPVAVTWLESRICWPSAATALRTRTAARSRCPSIWRCGPVETGGK